jgi:histidinol-phosphate aminotransferase
MSLRLDANEGPAPSPSWRRALASIDPDALRRYPDKSRLERLIADIRGVDPRQVVVTAGGDEAIDRVCRVALCAGRDIVTTTPTFEMIPRYAAWSDATPTAVPWTDGPFPTDQILETMSGRTGVIAIVSPNNPTGSVFDAARDLAKIASAAPQTVVLLDLAYVEFADFDPTRMALEWPNVVVIRTLSKAFGLAGLRCGYAMGDARLIEWMRAIGSPYPVSGVSLAVAEACLRESPNGGAGYIDRVRVERAHLTAFLGDRGALACPSQANFVLARFPDAARVWAALADAGIAVRRFDHEPMLTDCLRITCPGDPADFERLMSTLGDAIASSGKEQSIDAAIRTS